MDLTTYVDSVRRHLAAAAAAGGADAATADRLVLAIDAAVRLALMDALSDAAAEITSELPAGSIEVRLRGREPEFVVDLPVAPPATTTSPGTVDDEGDDDERTARVTLRIPESLKSRAEELAARSGHSLNTWLIFAIRLATRDREIGVDVDLGPTGDLHGSARRMTGRRMKGWV